MNKKYITSQKTRLSLALLLSIGLTACGGGGSSSTPAPIISFELLDPTPGASDGFGDRVIILPNGNIVVTDPEDSSISTNNGAVHLYDPRSQTLIASIYGDNANDYFGSDEITALANNNFVIASKLDDVAGITDAGSVRLVNGSTGAQIGVTIAGDNPNDEFGRFDVTILANNNFVIVSQFDDVAGIADAGSVRLVNGNTGSQIGAAIVGDNVDDKFGSSGIIGLENNNFVIASSNDDVAGITNAGSVRLVNGRTGEQISAAIVGDNTNDQIGRITALANNNFVIASSSDTVSGNANAGSVRLVNGITGEQIGAAIVGDNIGDNFSFSGSPIPGITVLGNNNFVIASSNDDVAGIINAGSVRLVSGSTGSQVGAAIVGDNIVDNFGLGGVTALANNNFVIASSNDDVAGITNAGSVRLVSGSTGSQVGAAIVGDNIGDSFGSNEIIPLANNNFVIASQFDDVAGTTDAGTVRLVNGSTGAQIGEAIVGDNFFDVLGSNGMTALANNNFVIASRSDDVAGITDAGSVRLVNGSTGAQIGDTISGDAADDLSDIRVTVLANNSFVIVAPNDDIEGITNAGSIRLVDGNAGTQIGDLIIGSVENDMASMNITAHANEDYYIMALPFADNNGSVDSGLVRLIAP